MEPPKNQNRKSVAFYKEKKSTHKRIKDEIDRIVPDGEDSHHWWLWSWLKNNLKR